MRCKRARLRRKRFQYSVVSALALNRSTAIERSPSVRHTSLSTSWFVSVSTQCCVFPVRRHSPIYPCPRSTRAKRRSRLSAARPADHRTILPHGQRDPRRPGQQQACVRDRRQYRVQSVLSGRHQLAQRREHLRFIRIAIAPPCGRRTVAPRPLPLGVSQGTVFRLCYCHGYALNS